MKRGVIIFIILGVALVGIILLFIIYFASGMSNMRNSVGITSGNTQSLQIGTDDNGNPVTIQVPAGVTIGQNTDTRPKVLPPAVTGTTSAGGTIEEGDIIPILEVRGLAGPQILVSKQTSALGTVYKFQSGGQVIFPPIKTDNVSNSENSINFDIRGSTRPIVVFPTSSQFLNIYGGSTTPKNILITQNPLEFAGIGLGVSLPIITVYNYIERQTPNGPGANITVSVAKGITLRGSNIVPPATAVTFRAESTTRYFTSSAVNLLPEITNT